ncbi:MAG: hypothetical protein J2O39_03640, partial [Acidimicrobiales bacterium]|nr:hypothetical protein [Acidimicrobiales bacterium]
APPSPVGVEREPIGLEDLDARSRAGAEACVADAGQGTSFDVAIVATKGRWLDRRSLVVEVELTLPSPLTLDRAVAMTQSVEAAVLGTIPGARTSGSGPAAIPRPPPWLSVSGRTNASATTAVVAASEQDLAGGS